MSTAPKHPWALSRTGAAALTAASLALTPHAALSQDTTVQLPEIQVQGQRQTSTGPVQGYVATQSASATKTDTPLIETPQSVTVVTRDQMDDRAVRNVEEALAYVPGLATGFSGNDTRFDSFRLRGFDARPSQFLDGLRLLRQFGPTSIEQDGLERIEVIRGPNSVLYGQTPPGGMINMIRKRPTERPFGEVNLQAGSYDRYQGSFDLGGPLTQDGQFLYRLTGLVRQSGTQVDHVDDDRYFIAPAITWRPGADTTLTLLGRFQYDQGGSPIGLPAVGTLLPNRNGTIKRNWFAGEPGFNNSDITTTSIGWNLEHRFDDVWSVRQNARYMHNRVAYETMYVSGLSADQRRLTRGSLLQRESSDTVNLDNSVEARFDTGALRHTVLAGYDFRQYWGHYQASFGQTGTVPSLDIFTRNYGAAVPDPRLGTGAKTDRNDDYGQHGIYLQDQVRLDRLLITGGLRQDWSTTSQTSRRNGVRTRSNDDALTGRIAVMYLFDFGLSPYASYTTSFDPVIGATAAQRGATPFKPTEGEQYELGVKYQPPGRNSFVTAAVFELTQTNVTTRDPVYTSSQIQTGEVRSRGVELEAVASLAEGLDLTASYTYLDAEITRSNTLITGTTRTTKGNRPGLVPAHTANLWMKYRFDRDSKLAGLGLGGGVRYIGNLYGEDANQYLSPSVTLFDASVSYDLGQYRLSVNASNLFDKEYVSSCTGTYYCYWGNGRTVIGNLAYRW